MKLDKSRRRNMKPFFCTLRVILDQPIVNLDPGAAPGKPLVGYYRSIGVRAANHNEAIRLFSEAVPDGRIDWEQSKFVEFEQLENDIAERYRASNNAPRWYLSGRALFQEEE
jgi:hypothetical protein